MPTPAAIFVFDLSATGVVRNAVALADALAQDRPVTVLTCRNVGVCGGAATPGGVSIVEVSALGLRSWVAAHRPLIAISAGNRGHPLFLPALAGLKGITRIYRFSNDIEHRRGGRGPGWPKRLADSLQLAALSASADRIVAVAPGLLADPRLAVAVASGRAAAIPNGVDTARVRALAAAPCPHPWASDGGPPFVLGIGRLTVQKNFALAVEAIARTPDLRLLILGDGPERGRLTTLAASLGIAGRVDLPGVTANPFPHLAAAACLALPSFWEGASNVLLEALATGTPVVASPTAGNAAGVLGHGRYGLLADPGDPAGWASALTRQCGPDAVRPGDRAEAFRLEDTLAAWRAMVRQYERA